MPLQPALLAQRPPEKGDARVVQPGGEIEQDGVLAEIGDRGRVEVLDRRIGPALQQRHPMIIGAHMHPPLVAAEFEHLLADALVGRLRRGRLVVDGLHSHGVSASNPVMEPGHAPPVVKRA